MSIKYLVISNCSSEVEANRLANCLVGEKLAACVNIIPKIKSIYRWNNAVQNETECMIFIKTTKDKYKDLEKRLKENHSYEVPEIISIEIKDGLQSYLAWVDEMIDS